MTPSPFLLSNVFPKRPAVFGVGGTRLPNGLLEGVQGCDADTAAQRWTQAALEPHLAVALAQAGGRVPLEVLPPDAPCEGLASTHHASTAAPACGQAWLDALGHADASLPAEALYAWASALPTDAVGQTWRNRALLQAARVGLPIWVDALVQAGADVYDTWEGEGVFAHLLQMPEQRTVMLNPLVIHGMDLNRTLAQTHWVPRPHSPAELVQYQDLGVDLSRPEVAEPFVVSMVTQMDLGSFNGRLAYQRLGGLDALLKQGALLDTPNERFDVPVPQGFSSRGMTPVLLFLATLARVDPLCDDRSVRTTGRDVLNWFIRHQVDLSARAGDYTALHLLCDGWHRLPQFPLASIQALADACPEAMHQPGPRGHTPLDVLAQFAGTHECPEDLRVWIFQHTTARAIGQTLDTQATPETPRARPRL